MPGKRHPNLVTREEMLALAGNEELPYFKAVEVIKQTPKDFGLNEWVGFFTLSDNWMKKIYREYVFIDTDIYDPDAKNEKFTEEKLKILNDHIRQLRRQKSFNTIPPQEDDLKEMLDAEPKEPEFILSDKEKRLRAQSRTVDLNSDNIAVCAKHKVQPEETIVRLALSKMLSLDPDEEQRYNELVRDKEYIEFLNKQVENYVKNIIKSNKGDC